MKWKLPPRIKIYEALGTLGDGRIEVSGDTAKVFSSGGNKSYTVIYDPVAKAIMSNDNGSYWQGYLGYPSIAYLMKCGHIIYDSCYADTLKGIKWKDLNTKFKNDYAKTLEYVHSFLNERGVNIADLQNEVENILEQIKKLNHSLLGSKTKPPRGY